jgi:hypothetical protein
MSGNYSNLKISTDDVQPSTCTATYVVSSSHKNLKGYEEMHSKLPKSSNGNEVPDLNYLYGSSRRIRIE